MADISKIAWTDSTFNPWIGCTKVSDGCKLCYAESLMDKRYQKVKWGPTGTRVRTSESYWKKPIQWNKENWFECTCGWRGHIRDEEGALCPSCGTTEELIQTRRRVFCASLADIFEDNDAVKPWRSDLFDLVKKTPNLDWLFLTKRVENMDSMLPWLPNEIPGNIWWGVSTENQKEFDARVPILESFGRMYFATIWLSIEPMLSEMDIADWLGESDIGDEDGPVWSRPIDWVVVGGESGMGCRPMKTEWARRIKNQCQEYQVPFFMKQLGGHPNKMHDLFDFPEDLRIRQFPSF